MTEAVERERLAAFLEVFRTHGYDAASTALLADAIGIRKASLYHRFPGGKQEIAEAVLAEVQRTFAAEVIGPLTGDAPPRERLGRFVAALREFYACGRRACLLGVLPIGSGKTLFQTHVRQALLAWADALTAVLRDAGLPPAAARRRATDAVVRIQGALVVARGLDDPAPFTDLLERLTDELLAP